MKFPKSKLWYSIASNAVLDVCIVGEQYDIIRPMPILISEYNEFQNDREYDWEYKAKTRYQVRKKEIQDERIFPYYLCIVCVSVFICPFSQSTSKIRREIRML